MTKLYAARGAQTVLSAEFVFDVLDTMVDVASVEKSFALVAAPGVFDITSLPAGAVVCGGEVVTETAVTGSTAYNVEIGDATTDNRYLASTDKTSAARTALVPTGFVSTGEALRLTVTPTVADATAGRIAVRVEYTIQDRMGEVYTH
jgi:hypothetical protein